jgi:hypothetical protein
MTFYFTAGQNVDIVAEGAITPTSGSPIIDFFNMTNPESYSWHFPGTSTGIGSLNVTIPVSGVYLVLLRLSPQSDSPVFVSYTQTNLTVNNVFYSRCVVTSSVKTGVTGNYPTPANFFTCKLTEDGDTWLFLEDDSKKIVAFNDDGGTKSDGYSWGKASRITTNLTNICDGYAFAFSSNAPSTTCDLYMGLASMFDYTYIFPYLATDNSFVSGQSDSNYSCYDWSVGETKSADFLPNYPLSDSVKYWDKFYEKYGYTRNGATESNAAIALWAKIWSPAPNVYDTIFTHASVRKNSIIPNPHGFEWESKCGSMARIMHTKDALVSANYGSILYYYQPDPTKTINYSLSGLESSFFISDLNQIASLKSQIPATIRSNFEEKYHAWENTWNRPELAIHSNPYLYAQSIEYESLLEYSLKYGKAIWPLLFDKLAQKDFFVVNLLKDLTYGGKRSFYDDIVKFEKDRPLPSTYTVLVDYCKGLLAREDVNIQKSIKDISSEGKEILNLNVTTSNNQEIKLNLDLEKDEKAVIVIYNSLGGLEYRASYNLSKGSQTVVINASNFKKGIYVVQIIIEDKIKSQTISI